MQHDKLSSLEKLFVALSDRTRLRLLGLMAEGEASVGFLVEQLNESQPKVSRHLAYLRSTGVVTTRRDGKWIYYGIAKQTDASATRVLEATLESINDENVPKFNRASAGSTQREVRTEETGSKNDALFENIEETASTDFQKEEMEVFLL